jgi:Flp pilus assembly pilin Flp
MHGRLRSMYVKFQDLLSGEKGPDLVEYRLLRTLIVLVMIRSISLIAIAVSHFPTNVGTSLV